MQFGTFPKSNQLLYNIPRSTC